jgi:hypothetical protein
LIIGSLAFGPAFGRGAPAPGPRPEATAPAKPVVPAATSRNAVRPVPAGQGSVFLLRGLLNVFSLGMDKLARKIRAKDIPVRVTNFTNWRGFANELASNYRTDKSLAPVVIIGHSLGADAAIDMANFLGARGVPVRLVVAFDGVHTGHVVSAGVAEVINYYQAEGWGKFVEAGPGFKGKLVNIDLSDRTEIDHLNIEKSDALQAEVIARLKAIFDLSSD